MNIMFTNRDDGETYARKSSSKVAAFDVSSYANPPFNSLSPFSYSKDFQIPVPGLEDTYSHSVEGVWQGLKIINGQTDFRLFEKKPRKRKGVVQGHKFGDKILDIVRARERIYIPSYTFYLNNYASDEAIETILKEQRQGKKVFLYDVGENGDIRDPKPLAHSSVLATYLNLKIFNQKFSPQNQAEKTLFGILDSKTTLEKKLELIRPLLDDLEIAKAFQYRCVDHPSNADDSHIAEALMR